MKQATQVYSREFDALLSRLPSQLQARIEARLLDLGRQLDTYPHHRLQGRSEFRLRIGDYRVVYEFDQERNILYLVTLGHRSNVYRH